MALQEYELVILRKNPDAPSFSPEEIEENGRQHREFLGGLREQGVIVSHGPVLDHPDKSVTAMMVYITGSVDETRRIAETDPAVKSGRLVPDVMRWRAFEGTLRLPGGAVG